jgi:hypothetical protein
MSKFIQNYTFKQAVLVEFSVNIHKSIKNALAENVIRSNMFNYTPLLSHDGMTQQTVARLTTLRYARCT